MLQGIEKDKLLSNVNRMGNVIARQLKRLQRKFPDLIVGIKQKGLMIGVELSIAGTDIVNECLEKGLLINCTQTNILRIMPSIAVKRSEITKAIKILTDVLKNTYAS